MASPIQLKNNAVGRLTSGVSSLATTLTLVSGNGAKFPTLTGAQYFPATLIRASDSAVEIVKVTARSGDVLTVVRAQEGTTGLALLAGDRVELRFTAGTLTDEVARIEAIAQDAASDAAAAAAAAQSTANSALSLASAAAPDTSVVKLTGDQTIAGVKTFSSSPVIPNAAAAQNPVSKAQLDAEAAARTAAIAAALLPQTLAPTLFVETTPKALTGVASVQWTAIPSWVRQIVIAISGQSGTSTGVGAVRIGTGGAAETAGYGGAAAVVFASTAGGNNSTFWRLTDAAVAASAHSHIVTISCVAGNTWVYSTTGALDGGGGAVFGGGAKTLAGALDMVQLIMTAGNFDAGTATLYYR